MSLGRSPIQEDLHRSTRAACEARLGPKSDRAPAGAASAIVFSLTRKFADLFAVIGP